MDKIIEILMNRDGCTRDEALKVFNEAKEAINDAMCCGDMELVEEIMQDELGLEMDYIFDIIF